jgi:SulP family sulfate permease
LAIVVVGFVQAVAIAKGLAYKYSYEIDSSQEMIALGLSNLVGSMFQSFPVTGAFGQTAVNDDIGAQTGLANVVTAAVVLVVLLFLTPFFSKTPLAVLAAIVISSVLIMFVSSRIFHALAWRYCFECCQPLSSCLHPYLV